jgi:hypothetical protein
MKCKVPGTPRGSSGHRSPRETGDVVTDIEAYGQILNAKDSGANTGWRLAAAGSLADRFTLI